MNGELVFFYDEEDKLSIEYHLSGTMICPDCRSLEDVEVPFDLSDSDYVTFSPDEYGFYLEKDPSEESVICSIVLPEVPIKVEKAEQIEYHSNDSWTVMTEEEYERTKSEKIDPRWEKLMEYKEGD